jgi:hypothetical protein
MLLLYLITAGTAVSAYGSTASAVERYAKRDIASVASLASYGKNLL